MLRILALAPPPLYRRQLAPSPSLSAALSLLLSLFCFSLLLSLCCSLSAALPLLLSLCCSLSLLLSLSPSLSLPLRIGLARLTHTTFFATSGVASIKLGQ